MAAAQQPSLKARALQALARREHARAELSRKLLSFEQEPGQLAQILDDLQAKGLLSDERAADALAHRRGKKLGIARVIQEMKERGIQSEAIAQAAEQLKSTQAARAREVWRKKFGEPAQNAAAHAKQIRFMLARGFAAADIRQAMEHADDLEAGSLP